MIKSVWKCINIIAISHKRSIEQTEIIDTFWTYKKPGGHLGPGGHLLRPPPRAHHQGAWDPGGGPLAPIWLFERFRCADFLLYFPEIFGAILIQGKLEI